VPNQENRRLGFPESLKDRLDLVFDREFAKFEDGGEEDDEAPGVRTGTVQ
jgi:hypothetical protein